MGQFIEQYLLLKNAENRENQLAKNRAKIIIQAYKVAFFVDFEKCRTIIQAHFSSNPVPLQTDCLDESLLAVAVDSVDIFVSVSHFPIEVSNIDVAIQIEGDVYVEEDCFIDSCLGDASK